MRARVPTVPHRRCGAAGRCPRMEGAGGIADGHAGCMGQLPVWGSGDGGGLVLRPPSGMGAPALPGAMGRDRQAGGRGQRGSSSIPLCQPRDAQPSRLQGGAQGCPHPKYMDAVPKE